MTSETYCLTPMGAEAICPSTNAEAMDGTADTMVTYSHYLNVHFILHHLVSNS